jgi:1,4-dihydroxy-2-naphthoate octaprenyltransferase
MKMPVWLQVFILTPRISKEDWPKIDIFSKWMIVTRGVVLVMTLFSGIFAGIFAYRAGLMDWVNWAVMTAGLVFAHATNNILNDITDFRRGVDKGNYFRTQYGPQPLEAGLLTERQMLGYAAFNGTIALLCGAYLVWAQGWLVLALMGAGAVFLLFYTWPLKYIGLGEITVLLVWGPLMIGGGYFAVTGAWSWEVVIASLPYAISTTIVLFGKHIDKHDSDKEKKIRTFPVVVGERAARWIALILTLMAYGIICCQIFSGFYTVILFASLVGLTAFPLFYRFYSKPRPAQKPDWYRTDVWPMWFVAIAFVHNRRFGSWFILALIVETVLLALKVEVPFLRWP